MRKWRCLRLGFPPQKSLRDSGVGWLECFGGNNQVYENRLLWNRAFSHSRVVGCLSSMPPSSPPLSELGRLDMVWRPGYVCSWQPSFPIGLPFLDVRGAHCQTQLIHAYSVKGKQMSEREQESCCAGDDSLALHVITPSQQQFPFFQQRVCMFSHTHYSSTKLSGLEGPLPVGWHFSLQRVSDFSVSWWGTMLCAMYCASSQKKRKAPLVSCAVPSSHANMLVGLNWTVAIPTQ